MTLSSERGLNFESVKTACELFVTNGYQPEEISLRDIRGETSGGSLTTISKYRKRWLSERRAVAVAPFQIEIGEMEGLRSSVEQLFSMKTTAMRAEFEVGNATQRSLIDRLELDLEEALKSNEQLQLQCQEASGRADLLQRDVDAANLRADELAAANVKLREASRRSLIDHGPITQIPPEPGSGPGAEPDLGSGKEEAK